MPQYRANSEPAIRELFTQEADALERHGFEEPDLSHKPEEYAAYISKLEAMQEVKPEVING